jgi:hypothetical protein
MEEKMTKEPAQSKPRGLLRKAFWTVAGVVGAGSLLGAKAASAHASGSEGPTTFTATGGATAVTAQSESGVGVSGSSGAFEGVKAHSNISTGVFADSISGIAVQAISLSNTGVYAKSNSGPGLHAISQSGIGAILENTSGVAVQVKERIQVQGDCIGQTYMDEDDDSITVYSLAATLNSVIVLTPLDPCYGVLYVTRATGHFTITRTIPSYGNPDKDLHIAYLIVN